MKSTFNSQALTGSHRLSQALTGSHRLSVFLIFVTAFSVVLTNAQNHIPKFAQSSNKSIKELTVSVENLGWLYFRSNAKVKANDLFTIHREAMGLQPDDKMKLEKKWRDELGYHHNRYQQYYKGIEVMYGVFAEHFARNDDKIYLANGKIIEGLNIDVTPSVKEEQALENVLKHLGAVEYAWQNVRLENDLKKELDSLDATYFPKGKLVFIPTKSENLTKENYNLSWQFEITTSNPASHQFVFVDAHLGRIISVNKTEHSNGPAELNFYGTQEIDTEWWGWPYYNFRLHANDNGRDIKTKIGGSSLDAFITFEKITDTNDEWLNAGPAYSNPTTAHWVTTKAWDVYQNTFNRCGVNRNCEILRVWADYQGSSTAAYSKYNEWYIGFHLNPNGNQESTLDIAGHEFTHGVLDAESGPGSGLHNQGGENGALGESFGDIMGMIVERQTLGVNNVRNFTHGEDCGEIFRSFNDPSSVSSNIEGVSIPHPKVYNGTGWLNTNNTSPDKGGIHHNCAVQNYWFYLLGNGGTGTSNITVNGIGFDKAAQIVYRSMTSGTLTQTSTFADARISAIQAANALYGNCSTETIETAKAWAAVGVGNVVVCPIYINSNSPYGTQICTNNLEYPYQFYATNTPSSAFTWTYPPSWDVEIDGSQLTVNNFGSSHTGQSAIITATSSTGQVGTLQLIFEQCTRGNELLKGQNTLSILTLNVFPNPVNDLLALKSNRTEVGQVDIYDSMGRLILTKKIAIDEDFIDISRLKNGLYLLKLSVENESSNASFFKN